MKYLTYILIGFASIILIFNLTRLNFDQLLAGDSKIALIGVVASLCAIILMLILLVSKKIKRMEEEKGG